MNGMTVAERLSDISKRTGLSEGIVRSVLAAERESVIDSLKKGERATLIGRCIFHPALKEKIEYIDRETDSVHTKSVIRVSVKAAPSLENELANESSFKELEQTDKEDLTAKLKFEKDARIVCSQLPGLL